MAVQVSCTGEMMSSSTNSVHRVIYRHRHTAVAVQVSCTGEVMSSSISSVHRVIYRHRHTAVAVQVSCTGEMMSSSSSTNSSVHQVIYRLTQGTGSQHLVQEKIKPGAKHWISVNNCMTCKQ